MTSGMRGARPARPTAPRPPAASPRARLNGGRRRPGYGRSCSPLAPEGAEEFGADAPRESGLMYGRASSSRRLHSTAPLVRAPAPGARTPSRASGAPGTIAGSALSLKALRGVQPLRARSPGTSYIRPIPRLLRAQAPRRCSSPGHAAAGAGFPRLTLAVTPRATRATHTHAPRPRVAAPCPTGSPIRRSRRIGDRHHVAVKAGDRRPPPRAGARRASVRPLHGA